MSIAPDLPSADIRIGYARCSTLGQELRSQLDALSKHGIPRDKIFSEKISTRVRVRPAIEEALRTAREVKAHAPHCRVIFTVYEMKRLGRDAAELTASPTVRLLPLPPVSALSRTLLRWTRHSPHSAVPDVLPAGTDASSGLSARAARRASRTRERARARLSSSARCFHRPVSIQTRRSYAPCCWRLSRFLDPDGTPSTP
ncbi:recombinase family protein [Streptomyces malaysiensis]|uniref:recombinase family protein n=1 Tax=Streptomyces malaysiensis TaxID=92644 RepID=UPI00371E8EA5